MATLNCVSFERAVPNPQRLARWMTDLDTPIDEHPAMVEAVDWLHHQLFLNEVEADPQVRDEWEAFLMSVPDESTELCEDDSDDF